MAVNTNIYGAPSSWVAVGNTAGNPNPDERVYMRPNPSASYTTTPLGMPLEKSISFSGLGDESAYSHLRFFENNSVIESTGTTPEEIAPTIIEDRIVTNWCFCSIQDHVEMSGWNQADNALVDGDETSLNANPLIQRYAPEPVQAYDNGSNIRPFMQFSYKNLVICIFVTCTSDFQNFHSYDLKTYKDNYTSTYPYITEVSGRFYSRNNNEEPTSINPRQVLWFNALNHNQIAVLDSLQLPITKPYMYGISWTTLSYNFKIMGGFLVSGQRANYNVWTSGSYEGYPLKYIGLVGTDKWKFYKYGSNGSDAPSEKLKLWGRIYRTYDSTFYEECMTQTACFGLLFTDNENSAKFSSSTADDMYMGILDEHLIGHGEYTHGTHNADNAQLNWTNSNDSSYDPAFRPDPNHYNGEMGTQDIAFFGTATTRYNLTAISTQLNLLPKLWDIMALADPDEAKLNYTLDMFLASNPIDSIVSLQFLPVKDIGMSLQNTSIHLGKYDTGISAQVAKTSIRFDCGDYEIYPVFGDNWIDREIQISLYLPFCGTINLEPEVYMNKTINVEYMIDLTTGSCSAVVSFTGDNGKRIITDVASGTCAIDLPVTGIQQQTLNSQLFNASETTKQLKVNNAFKGFRSLMGAVSSLNGDPMGSINSILGAGQDIYNIFQGEKIADYNLHHTMLPTKMIGTSGALTGAMCELYPTIIFSRPTLGYNEDFAHCQGFACCITAALTEYTGYTEVINPDLSGFAATAAEKEMIKSLLGSGVYL